MSGQLQIQEALRKVVPNLASTSSWLPLLLDVGRAKVVQCLQRSDISHIVKFASQAIADGNHQTATNWISLGLYAYPERTTDEIRRSGVFRSSKYRFRSSCLERVIAKILNQKKSLSDHHDLFNYLTSVSNLLKASDSIRKIDQALRKFLIRRQSSALKTIVALVDSFFMLDHEANYLTSSETWRYYSKEDLAEAASYLIYCFDSEIGISDIHFNNLDESAIVRGLYHKNLVKACKVRRYLEAEVLVDAFEYQCVVGKRDISVAPPYPDLEKSIRLGYVQNSQADNRANIQRIQLIRDGQLSVFQAADSFYDRFRNQVVRIADWPVRRYVFLLPDAPQLRSFFSHDGLLVEERIHLKAIVDAELATWDEIRRHEVRKGVTVFDLLKIFRLFNFIRHLAKRQLVDVLEQDPGLAYRSLVPVFEIGQIETLLECCMPKGTIDSVIDMLSWKSGANEIFDVQYKPLLKGTEHYLTPLNIAGTINWYRNLAYTQKHRVIDVAEEEAASRALSESLKRVSSFVRKGFKTKLCGIDIEIDVVARFGDYLFVFECKHALLPCNAHELRTTYGHLKKGGKTLSRIADLLSRDDIETELYRRLGWQVTPAKERVTCIVSCNGMFPGLSVSGHPVRRWTELRNMIESGTVKVGSIQVVEDNDGLGVQTDNLVEQNVWGGPELTPRFLREYIKGDWLRSKLFDAMVDVEHRFHIGKWDLAFPTFALDVEVAQQRIETLN